MEIWKIHYRIQSSGPPLLLIHGIENGASSYEWRKTYLIFQKTSQFMQ